MSGLSFSYDDVMKEISRINNGQQDGFIIRDLAIEIGMSQQWCREKVRYLIKIGRVVCAGRRKDKMIDGRNCMIPVYRMVE